MFTSAVKESREKEVTLEGINANGMHFLLDYAYTSRLALNLANIQDVLSAASHVQVVTVVEACSNYLLVSLLSSFLIFIISQYYFSFPQFGLGL